MPDRRFQFPAAADVARGAGRHRSRPTLHGSAIEALIARGDRTACSPTASRARNRNRTVALDALCRAERHHAGAVHRAARYRTCCGGDSRQASRALRLRDAGSLRHRIGARAGPTPSTTAVFRPHDRPAASRGTRSRSCIFDGGDARDDRDRADASAHDGVVAGPAIIEDAWSTVVVPPNWQARPDDLGNLFLEGERRMTTLDPFPVEVIRHGLSAAAEEMSLVMTRSARSPLLREAGDLSSAITDAEGGLAGQGRDIPIHLGAMAYTVKELLKVLPACGLQEGDAMIYNHRRARREPPQRREDRTPGVLSRESGGVRAQPRALAGYRRHMARELSRQRLRHVPGSDPHSADADPQSTAASTVRCCFSCQRARPRLLRRRPDGQLAATTRGRAAH